MKNKCETRPSCNLYAYYDIQAIAIRETDTTVIKCNEASNHAGLRVSAVYAQ